MSVPWIVAFVALWLVVLFLGFLLLGTLRNVGLLTWRLEQLEATTPGRLGRNGLKPGKKAPVFTLPSTTGNDASLNEFAGRKLLLVFVQANCGPCHAIVPELNRLTGGKEPLQVLAVNHASPEAARAWVQETGAVFPVVVQEDWSISKRYEVFVTPFGFLIDERGTVAAQGIVSTRRQLGYLLSESRRFNAAARSDEPCQPGEITSPQESESQTSV